MTARGEMQNNGVVRLRNGGSKGYRVSQVTIPTLIAQHIPLGSRFHVEVVDEGILLRYLGPPESVNTLSVEPPAWLEKS